MYRDKYLITTALLCAAAVISPASAHKLDCYPTQGASKDNCEARGCVWSPVEVPSPRPQSYGQSLPSNETGREKSRVDEPWCYFPDDYTGYRMVTGYRVADHQDDPQTYTKLVRVKPSGLPFDIDEVGVNIEEHKTGLRIRIFDAQRSRFEPELPKLDLTKPNSKRSPDLTHKIDASGRLIVRRKSTGAILFDTDLRKLIFSDKFIQLNSKLNSPFLYGLGEHYDTFLKRADGFKTYSFWNTDRLPLPSGTRSYGGFPFYINFDSELKHAHGLYLHNSNAMDIVLQSDQSITFRPIGGVLDMVIFDGPKPANVISEYQQAVGLPQLPPRWALGFHLCRYNYDTLEKTKLVWQRTRDAKIPFDVQWNDIDYMSKHNDFTYDHEKFAGLPEFAKLLHENNMHYVIILDPGVSMEPNYTPYDLGHEMNIFIKNATNQTLVGKVWNDSGKTVFPDFTNPKAIEYWKQLFVLFQKEVQFDGAWIDMNDISSMVDGSLDGCPHDNDLEQTIYEPGGYKLQTKTLCLSAKHKAGSEYDVHNLYSFYEAIATSEALKASRPNKRPLIISRSTFPGQGHYGGHWSGDVLSTWDYLRWSIPSLIEHSMYGYSLMGSDICGFVGNTTVELCARWSTLGAFYTFTRNHNDDISIDQDPVALGQTVVEANRNALNKRYSLLPYLYSLIYRAHKYGEPAIRAVPFEFYESDPESLKVEYQFMWGKGLMISPIVYENTFTKSTYLPKGRWYETDVLPEGTTLEATRVPTMIESKGEWHETKNVGLDNIPIFIRQGSILPTYPNVKQTVAETVEQPIGLEVALCPYLRAAGEVYLDDGDSLDSKVNNAMMIFYKNELTIRLVQDKYKPTMEFGRVKIFGFNSTVDRVVVNQKQIDFYQTSHLLTFDLNGAQVSRNQDLVVELK